MMKCESPFIFNFSQEALWVFHKMKGIQKYLNNFISQFTGNAYIDFHN